MSFQVKERRGETTDSTDAPFPGEKAREQKERQERDTRNLELAGSSYSIPVPSDFMSSSGDRDGETGGYTEDDLSGVPWGGLNIQHMVTRGHKSASQQSEIQPQQSPSQMYGSGGSSQQQCYDYDYENSYGSYAGTSSYGYNNSYGASSAAAGGMSAVDDRYFDTSVSSSSPSYFSYDAFSTGEDSGSNSGARF